jgi:hypothetical protein
MRTESRIIKPLRYWNLWFFVLLFIAFSSTFSFAGGRNASPPITPPTTAPVTRPSSQPVPVEPQIDQSLTQENVIDQNQSLFIAPFRWDFAIFPYDTEILQTEISQRIQDGLRPAGLHVVPGDSIGVLFVRIPLDNPRWTFVAIEPLSQVNQDFSAFLEAGWAPVDITLTQSDFHAMFTVAPADFLGWRIISQPMRPTIGETMDALVATALSQVTEDYYVHGITATGNQIHVLYARTIVPPLGFGVEFVAFPNDGTSPFVGIDAKIAQDALPVGIAVTEDWFIVAFYR